MFEAVEWTLAVAFWPTAFFWLFHLMMSGVHLRLTTFLKTAGQPSLKRDFTRNSKTYTRVEQSIESRSFTKEEISCEFDQATYGSIIANQCNGRADTVNNSAQTLPMTSTPLQTIAISKDA